MNNEQIKKKNINYDNKKRCNFAWAEEQPQPQQERQQRQQHKQQAQAFTQDDYHNFFDNALECKYSKIRKKKEKNLSQHS